MKNLKTNNFTYLALAASILVTFATGTAGAAVCAPGSVSYKKSIALALNHFVSQAENVAMSQVSGSLRISPINNEVTQATDEGYQSRITLRSSYHQVVNDFGVQVRQDEYTLQTNEACTDFEIININQGAAIAVESPDIVLSRVAQSGLKEYFKNSDVVPQNRHSGDHSLRTHTPKICSDENTASLNIVRSSQDSTGTVYKTTSYLIETETGKILNSDIRSGRLLISMCEK